MVRRRTATPRQPEAMREPHARRRAGREQYGDCGSRTLRACAGARPGADPVDPADTGCALAGSRADECRALYRDRTADIRGDVLRGADNVTPLLGFLRRQRVREFTL